MSRLPICGLLLLELSILSLRASDSTDPCKPPNFPIPAFGTAKVNVRDLGATGNGWSNDTAAINKAIEQCSALGGGDVIFAAGTYSAAVGEVTPACRTVFSVGGGLYSSATTLVPGFADWIPSTMTRSPATSPEFTTH